MRGDGLRRGRTLGAEKARAQFARMSAVGQKRTSQPPSSSSALCHKRKFCDLTDLTLEYH